MLLNSFFTESATIVANNKNAENSVYNKNAIEKLIRDMYPENVNEKGEISPSKYESLIKKARKRLRVFLLDTLEKFLSAKDKKAKEKFAKEFSIFYAEFYKVNDYTLHSVTNGKMKESAISVINNAFAELKKINEKQTTK